MHAASSFDALLTSASKPRVRVKLDVANKEPTESDAASAGICTSVPQDAADYQFRQTSIPVPFDRKLGQLERAVALLREQVLQVCADQDGVASSSLHDGQHADGAEASPEQCRNSDTSSTAARHHGGSSVNKARYRQPPVEAEVTAMSLPAFHPQYGYVLQPVYTAPAVPMPVCNPCGQACAYQSSAESLPQGVRPPWPAVGPHPSGTCGLSWSTPIFGGCLPASPMPVAAQPWTLTPNANATCGTWPSGWPPLMLQQPRPLQAPRQRLRSRSNHLPPWDPSILQKDTNPGPAHYTPKLPPACRSFNARFTPDPENPGYGEFSAAPLAARSLRRGNLGSKQKNLVGGNDAKKETTCSKGPGD